MKEQVDSLISGLRVLSDRLGEIGDVNEHHEQAKAELNATTETLSRTNAELAEAKRGLTSAQMRNIKSYNDQIESKTRQLSQVKTELEAKQRELADTIEHLNSASIRFRQIQIEMEELKKKFV